MRINNNMMAMNTHRQLGAANAGGAKSMEKLSSGMRINRAGDDAAGLAISEKMRGQIRGLNQASANAQDGISLIQTAEGALNETHAILQRMRELAVQSSTDTNNDADRGEIQKEVEQLKSEIDRISETTEFNTKKLLNGDVAVNTSSTSSFTNTKIKSIAVTNDNLASDTYTVTIASGNADVFTTKANTTDMTTVALNSSKEADMGQYKVVSEAIEGDNLNLKYSLTDQNGKLVESKTFAKTATTIEIGSFDITASAASTAGELTFTVGQTATFTVNQGTNVIGSKVITNDTSGKVNVGGFELKFDTSLDAGNDADVIVNNNALQFQIGANQDQTTKLAIGKMNTDALSIKNIDVSVRDGAEVAITSINEAIEKVSSERSKLGANQNRLDHTIKNLDTSAENLQSAEARIRDVDMAKEMMEQTRQNILAQASTAMLANANQAPQAVLQLLR